MRPTKGFAVELLPQSREALAEYLSPAAVDMEHELRMFEDKALRTVPECVAMSVTLLEDDLTFTLLGPRPVNAGAMWASPRPASPAESADDGAGGPRAAMDEEGWATMARAQASDGIASSVSLPVMHQGRAVLSIDLYASTEHAFHGHLGALADALGAWHAGAVTNADLGFESRSRAEAAPARLRDQRLVEIGIGLIAAREGVDIDTAEHLLISCAQAAGITAVQAALVLHTLHLG